jgi:hypothetical protein
MKVVHIKGTADKFVQAKHVIFFAAERQDDPYQSLKEMPRGVQRRSPTSSG